MNDERHDETEQFARIAETLTGDVHTRSAPLRIRLRTILRPTASLRAAAVAARKRAAREIRERHDGLDSGGR